MDLVVRGGTVVTAGSVQVADLGIENGTIAQIGGVMHAPTEIDATGRYVLPGGVDGHVHLTPAGTDPHSWRWIDDFPAGTAAALAGGITTVGNMCHPGSGESVADAIARDIELGTSTSRCDFFLHPVLMNPAPAELDALETLVRNGHPSVKIFLSFRRFDQNVDGYLEAMRRVGTAGGLALLHCEDVAVMECCCGMLRSEGRTHARHFPEARPVAAERSATERAVTMGEVTGCPVYVVHLSSAEALERCRAGQARGVAVHVETRPIYLFLTRERFDEQDGAKYAGAPPLRDPADVDALWAAIRQGTVATVATDHAPWALADKLDPALDATSLRLGMAELETMLPMLWWAGVRTGRISLSRFVEVTSTNPAKLFGLYPRKGTIAVGADADLVIWDDRATRRIDGGAMHSLAGWSPYDGWDITGWPQTVITRGVVAVADGQVRNEPGWGRLAARTRTEPL